MAGKRTIGVEVLRFAAQKRAEATSIRATAAEIGMSYTGFRAFLQGGKPHRETRRRLAAWYAIMQSRSGTGIGAEDVAAAAEVFAAYLRQAGTPKLVRERIAVLVDSLVGEFDTTGRQTIVPQLVQDLTSILDRRDS